MKDEYNRLLENISIELDIPPNKYQQAVERYEAVGRVLQGDEYEGEISEPAIYPQGSFRIGTVIRPVKEGKESDYDIDLVCELQIDKKNSEPRDIKNVVGDKLKFNGTYSGMLEKEGRRCWTLKYAEHDEVGFHLDVLPCLPEELAQKQRLLSASVSPELADQAISITHKNGDNTYEWSPSNPGGYADWFYNRMRPLFLAVESEQRRQIYENNSHLFADVEAVPIPLIRTPLQRTIQILKRHRDYRFTGHEWESEKPISMIITTLSARLYNQESDVFDTLENIITSLVHHAGLLTHDFKLDEGLTSRRIISRHTDGTWNILNPVNPGENFADRWHENDDRRARAFFRWVTWLHQDFIESLSKQKNMKSIGEKLERAFGPDIIRKASKGLFIFGAPSVVYSTENETPRVQIEKPSKPWGLFEK